MRTGAGSATVPAGTATTTVSPSLGARLDWAKWAVPTSAPMRFVSQVRWPPAGPAKQLVPSMPPGTVTVAVTAPIGTSQWWPVTFQDSSSPATAPSILYSMT